LAAWLTPEDVRELVQQFGVKFIRLQFTDLQGVLKNVAITADQLDKALAGELMFDGSSIEGFVRIEESDMYLRPDPSTFTIFPWRPRNGAVARLICDVYTATGEPFAGDPRQVLKRARLEAEKLGFVYKVGAEAEFFLFHLDEKGRPLLTTQDRGGYFDATPNDLGSEARREMVIILEEMGFEIEASHHEVAPGQHEIRIKYDDVLATADKIATFRFVVRTIAQRHGLHATFMPKPIGGICGSGMHISQSLFKDDTRNIFHDPYGEDELSTEALCFINGLLQHARGITAVTNPTVNSYKRLVPGYEAPTDIAWSFQNRSPLIRIPSERGLNTRIELRSPDPSCNPYLAMAVCLRAGLDGLARGELPPPPCYENLYELTDRRREELGIGRLPGSLQEAIEAMEADPLVRETLGEHVYERFIKLKKAEWDSYRVQVHPWEIERYLTLY